jgi:hypothetical protein
VHLAFYFPGGYIPGQDPFDNWLARFTIQALEEAGAVVLPVRYDDSVLAPNWERFDAGICREVRGALAFHRPDRVTVLGKSRGTQALRVVCTEEFDFPADARLIWQTPVWRSDRAWEAACATTLESLHLVGLADHEYHDPERHRSVRGETVEFPGGDHGLERAGDVLGSLDNVRAMAEAIIRFAGRM